MLLFFRLWSGVGGGGSSVVEGGGVGVGLGPGVGGGSTVEAAVVGLGRAVGAPGTVLGCLGPADPGIVRRTPITTGTATSTNATMAQARMTNGAFELLGGGGGWGGGHPGST